MRSGFQKVVIGGEIQRTRTELISETCRLGMSWHEWYFRPEILHMKTNTWSVSRDTGHRRLQSASMVGGQWRDKRVLYGLCVYRPGAMIEIWWETLAVFHTQWMGWGYIIRLCGWNKGCGMDTPWGRGWQITNRRSGGWPPRSSIKVGKDRDARPGIKWMTGFQVAQSSGLVNSTASPYKDWGPRIIKCQHLKLPHTPSWTKVKVSWFELRPRDRLACPRLCPPPVYALVSIAMLSPLSPRLEAAPPNNTCIHDQAWHHCVKYPLRERKSFQATSVK